MVESALAIRESVAPDLRLAELLDLGVTTC